MTNDTHVRQVPATETKYWTLDDIKAANRAAGLHFFAPDTLRFFRSRIGATVYQGPGGIYFVTSERFMTMATFGLTARKYTVRKFDPDTFHVTTVGEYAQLTTAKATRIARNLASSVQLAQKGGR
jgi:hypothetical protein